MGINFWTGDLSSYLKVTWHHGNVKEIQQLNIQSTSLTNALESPVDVISTGDYGWWKFIQPGAFGWVNRKMHMICTSISEHVHYLNKAFNSYISYVLFWPFTVDFICKFNYFLSEYSMSYCIQANTKRFYFGFSHMTLHTKWRLQSRKDLSKF